MISPFAREPRSFMRMVQLGMLPQPRGPGIAKVVAIGKELIEQRHCNDPLLKTYYGGIICGSQGYFDSLPIVASGLNALEPSGYPRECQRLGSIRAFQRGEALLGRTQLGSDSGRYCRTGRIAYWRRDDFPGNAASLRFMS